MTTEERIDLIKQVGEEIIQEEELRPLLESGEELIAYDGFEPSGQIHIAQGILRAINVNKMINRTIFIATCTAKHRIIKEELKLWWIN